MNAESTVFENTVAEIQISYHPVVKPSKRPKVVRPSEAYDIFLVNWDQSKIELLEQFKVMLLNRANKVLGICTLSSGSASGTIADPKQVFMVALKANATQVILAHNHPSGSLIPSEEDKRLTDKMRNAGSFLDIKVIDHIIITPEGFYSFADEGVI